jgi:hypothetical protein
VLYFWSGEKHRPVQIIIFHLEAGAMEEISSQFHVVVVGGWAGTETRGDEGGHSPPYGLDFMKNTAH